MSDQAANLRALVRGDSPQVANPKQTKVITITSGKGGVGKSNFTLNFALSLQSKGYKVVVFDADIGLANLDVLMGVTPSYNLYHLLRREKTIWEVLQKGVQDLEFIAGGSGFQNLLELDEAQLSYFLQEISKLNGYADFILFDTGAGLSKETLRFILAAHEVILVTIPEPTAITDAYAIIKMVHATKPDTKFQLMINRATDAQEGTQTAQKITMVAKQFLNMEIQTLGFIPEDSTVSKAVKRQVPFVSLFPFSPASKKMDALAEQYKNRQKPDQTDTGVKGFLQRLIKLLH